VLAQTEADKSLPFEIKIEDEIKIEAEIKLEDDSNDITDHQRNVKPRPYQCTVCGRQFRHKGRLDQHQRAHTGKKLFTCTVCDKRFASKGHLIQHQLTHTGDKPCVCSVCEQAFKTKRLLRDHENRHYGDRLYCCCYCEKSFTSKDVLGHHVNLHTSKFECAECGKCCQKFKTIISLQYTCSVIQVRDRSNLPFATNGFREPITFCSTVEFMVKLDCTNVMCVARRLDTVDCCMVI